MEATEVVIFQEPGVRQTTQRKREIEREIKRKRKVYNCITDKALCDQVDQISAINLTNFCCAQN